MVVKKASEIQVEDEGPTFSPIPGNYELFIFKARETSTRMLSLLKCKLQSMPRKLRAVFH
jgi:hypothetical protein